MAEMRLKIDFLKYVTSQKLLSITSSLTYFLYITGLVEYRRINFKNSIVKGIGFLFLFLC